MKATIDDYKKDICSMVNSIDDMQRLIKIYSFTRAIFGFFAGIRV